MMKELGRRFILGDDLQNKKVVIYGAGDTGKTLYSQLLEKRVDVVAVLDKNADSLENTFFCPLIKPEFFNNNFSQDFIFIANASIAAKEEIKQYLIENEIKEETILYLEENFYDGVQEYQMKDDPEDALYQLIQANDNIKGNVILTKQFHIWMRVYYSCLTDKESFKNKIKYEFHNNGSNEIRIMLGLYLYELEALDVVEFRQFVEYVSWLSTEQYDWMYFLIVRLYHMSFVQNKLLYKGICVERRALWKRILEYYGLDDMLKSNTIRRTEGKLAILVHNLLGPDNSPAMIYRMMANHLKHIGKKVKIFVISAFAGKKSFGFLSLQGGASEKELSIWDPYNRKMLDSDIEIEYITGDSISKLLSKAAHEIIEFGPQYIIDIMNETSPISGILYKYFPVLGYALAAGASGTFFTRTTAALFEYNEEIAPYHVTLPRFLIEKDESASYNKSDRLGIPEDSFVVVTVGNRLYAEIDQSLINHVIEMLQKNKKMYWVLVGDTGELRVLDDLKKMGNRVLLIPYEDNLSALYKLCDVYLNPDRIGGGFSIMFAMQQKVVIAALKKNIFGGGGGAARVGENELIEGHYKELCGYIEKLYESPDLLKEKKEEMWEIIHEKCSTERWREALCDALDSTEQAFLKGENNDA